MKKFTLIFVALVATLVLGLPAFAAPTSLLRLPTADVLNFGQVGVEADLYGPTRAGHVEAGLPAGFMLGVTVPMADINSGITIQAADLRYRPLQGTLVTPALAVGATYDETMGVSPYVAVTKGFLNATVTAGARLQGIDLNSATIFGGVDLGLLGPLHVVGEYDGGEIRYGAEFRALNARLSAYLEGTDISVVGRVVLPF